MLFDCLFMLVELIRDSFEFYTNLLTYIIKYIFFDICEILIKVQERYLFKML